MSYMDRVYTVPLGKVLLSPDNRRAKRAINMIKEFVRRHTKIEDVRIEEGVSHQIWSRGIRHPPRKIKVTITQSDAGFVLVSPYDAAAEPAQIEPTEPEEETAAAGTPIQQDEGAPQAVQDAQDDTHATQAPGSEAAQVTGEQAAGDDTEPEKTVQDDTHTTPAQEEPRVAQATEDAKPAGDAPEQENTAQAPEEQDAPQNDDAKKTGS